MKQLTGMDHLFLQLEDRYQHMHVAGLGVYDMSTAPGRFVRFKEILNFFESRLDLTPVFRRRLVSVPFSIDRPYWIEDPEVDVEYHVRHIALPKPGDWRQLWIAVARIHSRPLDRTKPLWESYVIEGLDNIPGIPKGSFAFYTKVHHAAVDGEAGAEILKAMHSLSPDPTPTASQRRVLVRDREPLSLELYTRAIMNNLQRVPDAATFSMRTAMGVLGLGAGYLGKLPALLQEAGGPSVEALTSMLRHSPRTRFSGKVSAHRVITMGALPLSDMKEMRRKVEGATINDLFLTVVGGAIHKYLGSKGELPDRSMTAQIPMTLRGAAKGEDVGTQVGFTVMPIHTEIADPLERLTAIRGGAGGTKAVMGKMGKDLTKRLADSLPAAVSELITTKVITPTMNVIVSNVRGPDVPLYLAGAKMVAYAPLSVALHGIGLNVTGFSYDGRLWVSAVSCRTMMPDPGFFAECIQVSFDELVNATAGLPDIGKTASRSTKKRSPRKRRGVAAKDGQGASVDEPGAKADG